VRSPSGHFQTKLYVANFCLKQPVATVKKTCFIKESFVIQEQSYHSTKTRFCLSCEWNSSERRFEKFNLGSSLLQLIFRCCIVNIA